MLTSGGWLADQQALGTLSAGRYSGSSALVPASSFDRKPSIRPVSELDIESRSRDSSGRLMIELMTSATTSSVMPCTPNKCKDERDREEQQQPQQRVGQCRAHDSSSLVHLRRASAARSDAASTGLAAQRRPARLQLRTETSRGGSLSNATRPDVARSA